MATFGVANPSLASPALSDFVACSSETHLPHLATTQSIHPCRKPCLPTEAGPLVETQRMVAEGELTPNDSSQASKSPFLAAELCPSGGLSSELPMSSEPESLQRSRVNALSLMHFHLAPLANPSSLSWASPCRCA